MLGVALGGEVSEESVGMTTSEEPSLVLWSFDLRRALVITWARSVATEAAAIATTFLLRFILTSTAPVVSPHVGCQDHPICSMQLAPLLIWKM